MSLFQLLCFGILIHVIFLLSVFDIYFKSPILTGVLPQANEIYPPGKRVVFISVDGLRLDSLFDTEPDTGRYIAEYVQNIIKHRGSWGVSQCHVPTESRPGHVAMLAGFYEDPSAVTKGWTENPVNFDSIFNRSYCSFAWGSPDIVNIFYKGLKHRCAFMETYKNEQNFAGDTKEYDNWVYNKLMEFMSFSKESKALYNEGIFFFLHLLGQDTSGHTDKPHTQKYRENLRNVDEIIEKIENAFYDFYGDDKTTYIFTSDHGMTNWGSHGAGDLDEINTPFVAWGAGIRKPTTPPRQITIDQADITPLLAILLGSTIPVNSVGVLPVSILNMSKRQISQAMLLNAKQIASQYIKAFQNTKEQTMSWLHVPFKGLSLQELNSRVWSITDSIKSERYMEAIESSRALIDLGLEGLEYYQNYYRRPLLLCVSLSYVGWIFYLLLELYDNKSIPKEDSSLKLELALGVIVFITFTLISIQKLPIVFYGYALLPEFLWYNTIKKACDLQSLMKKFDKVKCVYFFVCVMCGVEILVISFFQRSLLCICIISIILWSLSSVNFKENKQVMGLWLMSGVALGIFSLLPTVGGKPNPLMVAFSGLGLCVLSITSFSLNHENTLTFCIRLFTVAFSTLNSYIIHNNFDESQLPILNQLISWGLCIVSCFILITGRKDNSARLHHIFTCLSVPFILLSVTHEGFFLIFLFIHLLSWIHIESLVSNQNQAVSDFRIAYFFLSYIFIAFFGIGNIASLNSFDPAWVRCFLTVFSPFVMSSLILFKTVIPFMIVTCTFRTITDVLKISPGRLFIIVLIYCNIMGLNFLFLIKNKGSWLDIGTSLSHYVIQQVTIVFLVVLYGIAKFLTKNWKGKDERLESLKKEESLFLLPIFYGTLKVHKS